jgi:hypothetical protein
MNRTQSNSKMKNQLQSGSFAELNTMAAKIAARDAYWAGLCNDARETVANDERETAVANAWTPDDAVETDADGWFKVSPYGVFPGKTPGRDQHFFRPQAKRMVSEFNSVFGRLGRLFRGVPLFIGHPDVDPTIWKDDRRLGKAAELQDRDDGLWARSEYNSLGKENQREGYWVYPSPRWDAPAGGSKFEPDRLISIGFTNTPRIPTAEPAVANSALETEEEKTEDLKTEDSRQEQATNEPQPTDNTDMDPKIIREKLGLAPETTDEEVLAKIDSLVADAAKATEAAADMAAAETAKTTAETEKDTMANSLAAEVKRSNGAIIELAVLRGSITAAEKPAWETKLADGTQREAAVNSITALRPRLNTTALGGGQNRADREAAGNMREQVANAVAALEDKGMPYQEAWCQVKKRPEFAAYFGG